MLNNTLGPKKSIEEWKTVSSFIAIINANIFNISFQVFLNWKNQLKARSRKMKQLQDGNVNSNDKNASQKFTDVEKRAFKLWKEDIEDIESITVRGI